MVTTLSQNKTINLRFLCIISSCVPHSPTANSLPALLLPESQSRGHKTPLTSYFFFLTYSSVCITSHFTDMPHTVLCICMYSVIYYSSCSQQQFQTILSNHSIHDARDKLPHMHWVCICVWTFLCFSSTACVLPQTYRNPAIDTVPTTCPNSPVWCPQDSRVHVFPVKR